MPIITVPEVVRLLPLRFADPTPPWTRQPDGSELCVGSLMEPSAIAEAAVLPATSATVEAIAFDKAVPSLDSDRMRPYQRECVDAVFQSWKDGKKAPLIVIATAGGKTVVAAEIIRQLRARSPAWQVWFVAPLKSLIEQTYRTIKLIAPEASCGIVQGGRNDIGKFVSIVSTDTVTSRNRFDQAVSGKGDTGLVATPPSLVILDECHMAASPKYKKLIAWIREVNPECLFLGMSVGPDSYIELRGGPFSTGFVGRIEDAWEKAARSIASREAHGFDVVDLSGVQARGWTGDGFSWKTCRRLLRHLTNGKPCSTVSTGGRVDTVLTDDHAVYAAAGEKGDRPAISTSNAAALAGAILVGDDGAQWAPAMPIGPLDMLSFARLHMGDYRVYAVCDVKSVPRHLLRTAGLRSPRHVYDARKAGSLPVHVYCELGVDAPPTHEMRVTGSPYTCPTTLAPEHIAFVLGVWLGDGWIDWERERADGRGRVSFAVANHQVADFRAAIERMPLTSGVSLVQGTGASAEVRVSNAFFGALCRHYFGHVTASTKRIPSEWIISWSEVARRELLRGLIFSDGSTQNGSRQRVRRQYRTTSWGLARDALSLLRSLGIAGSLDRQAPRDGGVVAGRRIRGRHMSYVVHWSGHAESGDNSGHRGARSRFDHSVVKFHERPVRRVEPLTKQPAHVFDVEMDGHPSFVVNGVLVHNTATPGRTDGSSLDSVFDTVAYQRNAFQLIADGFLVPPVGFRVNLNVDLDVIATENGEFKKAPLSKVMNQPAVNNAVVDGYVKYGDGRKLLGFCVDVQHSQDLAETFRSRGIPSRSIDGSMKDADRTALLLAFAKGEIRILTSCNVIAVGYDEPSAQGVLFARPTNSQVVYIQSLGRGLRLHPSKRDALVIDCVGNSTKHPLAQLASLAGLAEIAKGKGKMPFAVPEPEIGTAEVGGLVGTAIDFRMLRQRASKWAWRETRFGWAVSIPRIGYFLLAWCGNDRRSVDVRFHDMREGRRDSPPINLSVGMDFDMAYGLVEQEIERLFSARTSRARINDKDDAPSEIDATRAIMESGTSGELFSPEDLMRNDAGWRDRPTSERQRAALIDAGVKPESVPVTGGEASDLFTVMQIERNAKMREPATKKQMDFIMRHHLASSEELVTMTKKQAQNLVVRRLKELESRKRAGERFAAEDEAPTAEEER